ncbi:MAG TPA: helical backbone metal receptor [Gemmatimonadaceae bacterium]
MPVLRSVRLVAALVLALGACAPPERGADAAVDDFGDTIRVVPAARRIVSLNPATTEILFALGAGDRLVGRTRWDRYPDAALAVPDLGDGIRPNVEAVLAARPDLVVLYASDDNRAAAQRLRAAGVRTVAVKVDSVAEFRRVARLLGRLAGDSLRGEAVVDSVDATLARVRAATRGLERPTVFIRSWKAPLLTIGGGSFMTELLDVAGARNVYAELPGPSPHVSLEDVVRRDPDVVLASPEGRDDILADPAWRGVRAVREGRVLAFDYELVARPSVRLGEAAVALGRLLHPGLEL